MGRRKQRHREPETARIESITHDGRGIAAVDGKKVFVAGALAGLFQGCLLVIKQRIDFINKGQHFGREIGWQTLVG